MPRAGRCRCLDQSQIGLVFNIQDNVRAKRPEKSARIMKKMPNSEVEPLSDDEMLPEYNFDYRRAKPNRFVVGEDQQVVILDSDVARYFRDSESVNRVLRALINSMPHPA